MAISVYREPNKQSGQSSIVSGLWKIWVGAPILAPRQTQRRAFSKLASQLGKNQSSFTRPNLARHLSSCSSASKSTQKTGFLNWYLRKLETHPISTKSVSSSLIYTSADITSQMITMPADGSFDFHRMLRISAYGFIVMGPSQHYWFTSLSKIMPHKTLATTLSKIFMGQFIYGPCLNTIFYSYNAVFRGESRDEIVARLKRDLLPTLKNGLMYWPLCDFFTFTFVPVHLQPLMNSSFAYVWTISDIHGKLEESWNRLEIRNPCSAKLQLIYVNVVQVSNFDSSHFKFICAISL